MLRSFIPTSRSVLLRYSPVQNYVLRSSVCRGLINAGQIQSYSQKASATATSASDSKGGNNGGKGKLLLILGLLALGSSVVSLSYQKNPPVAFEEGPVSDDKKKTPAFSKDDVLVVFVLGGPGAGKGTQCAKLVKDFGFVHLSAGDLLRAEQAREGSQYGELIKKCIKDGEIVPQEVTVALLKNAITSNYNSSNKKFLVDGFPRKMDQAITFEEEIVPSTMTLFFDCPEKIMLERLLQRGKTSGRIDDNIESIQKRFKTFVETSVPVVEYFEKQNKVVKVSCNQPVDEVYQHVTEAIKDKISK
ncbi:bifunctional uridylate/adenylate kinase [Kluyveromyces lactis]|uniref:Uridylate kinase n=1 Tax=Kluyveromyces lactis (strain ATCC 8585 / CBS 2359 / DSM 70799 / NBRC 1267 / NRRL Y-1140 / WM37) TaxID=284590 RepID=Q6CP26_KLULA|nr:uncharacterized protein KLLA0_E08053g [Kluyveromyces lactis]CAG99400.1 KLLA0E08053p [Kluyveromyces lactis]|eukprot:XP_454313.1 uncharacterized protein KLLA0_E08053g [Kluyveromyces lactis]